MTEEIYQTTSFLINSNKTLPVSPCHFESATSADEKSHPWEKIPMGSLAEFTLIRHQPTGREGEGLEMTRYDISPCPAESLPRRQAGEG